MNLFHYFKAVNFAKYAKELSYNWRFSLGATIEKQTLKLRENKLKNIEIAIVGVPFSTEEDGCSLSKVPDLIRKELYQLAGMGKINMVDFGNLKPASSNKGNYLAVRDVVDYLYESDVVTLVLGGSQDFSYGVCQAFRNHKFFSFCTIDAFLDVKKGKEAFGAHNYLSRIFASQPNIFQFSLLAYQSYYVANQYFTKTKGLGMHLRLGQLRNDLTCAEPVFRNSDFLSFDFNAIKHTDAPGQLMLPNGLHSEEACQLARYAGLSNRLGVFGLFGLNENVKNSSISIQLAAQVLWYFIEGFLKRSRLNPEDGEGFSVYKVDITELASPLVFYQNDETKQWWIEAQAINEEKRYVACTEKDYEDVCNNEIPQFWLNYIQKIDEILK
jgi:arginase family enzyme